MDRPSSDAHWLALKDRLLRELCHDLNGRASALRGLAELHLSRRTTAPERSGPDTRMLLQEEADRLEELARNLDLLTARTDHPPELLDLQPILERAIQAVSLLEGVGGERVDLLPPAGDPPPVRGVPAVLGRIILVAIEAFLSFHGDGRARTTVQLGSGGRGAELRIRLGYGEGRGRPGEPSGEGVGREGTPRPPELPLTPDARILTEWKAGGELRLFFPPP
ncbi:MAG: sensor histidine kinase [Gemmatimonadales bacterium]|nr:MAG: sensor histidine kinase [Gemmatimonadales bacterium]